MLEAGLLVSPEGDEHMYEFFLNAFELGMKSNDTSLFKETPELAEKLRDDLTEEIKLHRELKKNILH
jgi:hypothetical protein